MVANPLEGELRSHLETDGYALMKAAVAPGAVVAALRMLGLAMRRHGLSAAEIAECQQTTFYPHLRWEPEVWAVLPATAGGLLGEEAGDEWAEPQLLLRFPDEDGSWPLVPHVDEPPAWAGGRAYRGVVGVALTDAGEHDGVATVWPGSHRQPAAACNPEGGDVRVAMEAGDALLMHPLLRHAGTLNLGARVRHAVYFRLLAAPLDASDD